MKHNLIMLVDVPADLGKPSVEKADTLIFKIKPQTIVHIILRNSCFGTINLYIYIGQALTRETSYFPGTGQGKSAMILEHINSKHTDNPLRGNTSGKYFE